MSASNTAQLLYQAAIREPLKPDSMGTLPLAWQLFFSQVALEADMAGSGNGDTTIENTLSVGAIPNFGQDIEDLQQKVRYALMSPTYAAVAMQAAQNAAEADQSVSITGMVLTSNVSLLVAQDSNTNLDMFCSWFDLNATQANANSQISNSNTQFEVTTIAGPPAFGVASDVQSLYITNNGANASNVNVQYSNSSSNVNVVVLQNVLLDVGCTLIFEQSGFRVLNAQGVPIRH